MKKFKFSLETLKKYRKIVEDKKKKEFFLIRIKAAEKEGAIKTISKQLENIAAAWGENSEISLSQIQQNVAYIESLKQKKLRIENELVSIKEEEALKRKELLEASKNRKIILKLKENRWKHYLEEYKIEENKNMSEIAQINFLRSKA